MKYSLISGLRQLVFALAFTVTSFATTFYVSTEGSDSSNGAQAAPLATLAQALSRVKAGDVISLGAGTFSGDASATVNGTATNRITIQGAGIGSTIFTDDLTINADYYSVKNITFRGNSVTFKDATNGIMENCEAYHGLNNFKIIGGTNCIVRNCSFRRPGANSMGNVSGKKHLIEGNTFTENNGFDVHRTNNAIECVWRGNHYNRIGTPNNNKTTSRSANTVGLGRKTFIIASGLGYEVDDFMRISDAADSGKYLRAWVVTYSGTTLTVDVQAFAGSGPCSSWDVDTEGNGNHADIVQSFTYDNYGCVFEDNRLDNCTSQLGMFEANPDLGLGKLRDWTFRNNIFYNSRIQINIDAPGFKFYNNTVYNASGTTGFRGTNSTKGNGIPILVYNNIFCRVGSTETSGPYSGALADYNLITDYPDDSAKTGFSEAHGINGGYTPNQIFVDPENGDLRLKSGSPALGAGADLRLITGLLTDVTEAITAATWDMGASGALSINRSTLTAPSNARVSSATP